MTHKTTNTKLKTRSFFGVLRTFLVLCVFGMFVSQGAFAQEAEAKPQPQLQRDAEPVKFVFLYREGSIEPDAVKKITDALNMTTKEKSSPRRTDRESAQGGKGKPISPTKPILTVGDIEEAFRSAGYGAKLTKADAARINPQTPIEDLFKNGNSVVGFNINTKDNTAQQLELPIKLEGDTEDEATGITAKKPGGIPIRLGADARLIVFTFNQTRETLEKFKEVFCLMYPNDCGGTVGTPVPLSNPVIVVRYNLLDANDPLTNNPDYYWICVRRGSDGTCLVQKTCVKWKGGECEDWVYVTAAGTIYHSSVNLR